MESNWRWNVFDLGLTQLDISLIAKVRTQFAGIEYIVRRPNLIKTGIYVAYRNPLGFETYGWAVTSVPYVIAPKWPGFFDVYPD